MNTDIFSILFFSSDVTDAGNEWHYLFEWSDGTHRFIESANLKRWYRLVIEYLETVAV